ncbi:MAG: hypothetical protein ORN54_02520 [Cyclobacteriaceae bacterium]|nr:hypothetical protein [Cyclobacteriaceae bacterium]
MKHLKYVSVLLVLACPLGASKCGADPRGPKSYFVYLFYKNDKGEDLFDINTKNHLRLDQVKLDPEWWSYCVGKWESGNMWNISGSPLGNYVNVQFGNINSHQVLIIIKINPIDTDTLEWSIAGGNLVNCQYNKRDIKPATDEWRFPAIIVK